MHDPNYFMWENWLGNDVSVDGYYPPNMPHTRRRFLVNEAVTMWLSVAPPPGMSIKGVVDGVLANMNADLRKNHPSIWRQVEDEV